MAVLLRSVTAAINVARPLLLQVLQLIRQDPATLSTLGSSMERDKWQQAIQVGSEAAQKGHPTLQPATRTSRARASGDALMAG